MAESQEAATAATMDCEIGEPSAKKPKLDLIARDEQATKLESRLGDILCCTVCMDLPKASVFQCPNGHLMCAICFTHLLADAKMKDETSTCPNCRVEIRPGATRNLAVEKAVSELPSPCQFCEQKFTRNLLPHHEKETCEERTSRCQYHVLGCGWKGPFHELTTHEQQCAQPSLPGAKILPYLRRQALTALEEKEASVKLSKFLSWDKLAFFDLELKPHRTEEFIHKLYYESLKFSAFGTHWCIKARLNDNARDPHLTNNRYLSYQLMLRGGMSHAVPYQFLLVRGPHGDAKIGHHVYSFEFSEAEPESPFYRLPLTDSGECNRLLAARSIDLSSQKRKGYQDGIGLPRTT